MECFVVVVAMVAVRGKFTVVTVVFTISESFFSFFVPLYVENDLIIFKIRPSKNIGVSVFLY